jgi:hypothetical protein
VWTNDDFINPFSFSQTYDLRTHVQILEPVHQSRFPSIAQPSNIAPTIRHAKVCVRVDVTNSDLHVTSGPRVPRPRIFNHPLNT